MILYKGSKLDLNPFEPQLVHPDDYHKFPEPMPTKVIFASESETKAKIFAVFSRIISFSTETSVDKPAITITIEDPIEAKSLNERVYLYEFDTNTGDWKYLKESGEWYSTEPQIPITVKEYTREELYSELRNNSEISFRERFKEEEPQNLG